MDGRYWLLITHSRHPSQSIPPVPASESQRLTTIRQHGTGPKCRQDSPELGGLAGVRRASPADLSCPSRARAQGPAPKKTPTVIHRGLCPSWARAEGDLWGSTRTLLIQSPVAQAGISDHLLGFGHFPSIGARIPAVVCPLVPGEATAKTTVILVRDPRGGSYDPRSRMSFANSARTCSVPSLISGSGSD